MVFQDFASFFFPSGAKEFNIVVNLSQLSCAFLFPLMQLNFPVAMYGCRSKWDTRNSICCRLALPCRVLLFFLKKLYKYVVYIYVLNVLINI